MRKIKYKKGRKVHPSTLEYTGNHKDTPTEIQLFVYNADDVTEIQQLQVDEIQDTIDTSKVNWLNIHGLNEPDIIAKIGEKFENGLKEDNDKRKSIQSVEIGVRVLLALVETGGGEGAFLREVADHSGLSRSQAHRVGEF